MPGIHTIRLRDPARAIAYLSSAIAASKHLKVPSDVF
jgi:hypothetical protein